MNFDWKTAVESSLRKNQINDALYLLDGVRIIELDQATPILDRHKDAILRWLLTAIANYGLNDSLVEYGITALRRARVSWPEMTTILNSRASDARD